MPENRVIILYLKGITILVRENNEKIIYKYETIKNWVISKKIVISISLAKNGIKRVCLFTIKTLDIQA